MASAIARHLRCVTLPFRRAPPADERRHCFGFSTRRLRHLQLQPHPGGHPGMQPTQKLFAAVLFAVLATMPMNPAPATTCSGTAVFQRIVLVLFENTNYDSVIGNTSAPYFNSLANTYGLATN